MAGALPLHRGKRRHGVKRCVYPQRAVASSASLRHLLTAPMPTRDQAPRLPRQGPQRGCPRPALQPYPSNDLTNCFLLIAESLSSALAPLHHDGEAVCSDTEVCRASSGFVTDGTTPANLICAAVADSM